MRWLLKGMGDRTLIGFIARYVQNQNLRVSACPILDLRWAQE